MAAVSSSTPSVPNASGQGSATAGGARPSTLSNYLARNLFNPELVRVVSGKNLDERLLAAFNANEQSGLMLASLVRVVIILSLSLFFIVTGSYVGDGILVLVVAPLFIALTGAIQFEASRRFPHLTWPKFVLVAIDCAYLAAFLIARHKLASDLPPVTLAVKEGGLLFFTAFLVHGAFSYSPRFILWTGACITVAWIAILIAAAMEPGTRFSLPYHKGDGTEGMWYKYGDPYYLPVIKIVYDYVIVMFLVVGLAVAMARSQRIVRRTATAERSRATLARHFSPQVIEILTNKDVPLGDTSWQPAAVLMADIRGFTSLCETLSPSEVVNLLRDYYAAMEECVFNSGGTIDKFMGDGVLAVFGVPNATSRDASNALSCARAMLAAVDKWSVERIGRGQPPLRVGISLHYGHVMLGDVGTERLATFTVIGDSVNITSRLQALTKDLHTNLVASAEFMTAIRAEVGAHAATLAGNLKHAGEFKLRGREQMTDVYAARDESPAAGLTGI